MNASQWKWSRTNEDQKVSRMPSGHPVSLYLLHVPLGGALTLPVATGLARGAEQQGGQFVYPLRGGDGTGRHRRGRRCGAQPVIPPQHRPQHPRVLPSVPPRSTVLAPSMLPPPWSQYPFYRGIALRVFLSSSSSPLVHSSSQGGDHLPETPATEWAIATPVAGELRPSADVASPRLDVDDDVDVHTRSPARDTGAYHDTGPKRISDVLTAAAEVWDFDRLRMTDTLRCLRSLRSHFVVTSRLSRERELVSLKTVAILHDYQLFVYVYSKYKYLNSLNIWIRFKIRFKFRFW